MFHVIISPAGTFTTDCFETALTFFDAGDGMPVTWEKFDSYEEYIVARFDSLFESETRAGGLS